jgi:hypothetical protein
MDFKDLFRSVGAIAVIVLFTVVTICTWIFLAKVWWESDPWTWESFAILPVMMQTAFWALVLTAARDLSVRKE